MFRNSNVVEFIEAYFVPAEVRLPLNFTAFVRF
jgi:hypothetical protein